MPVAFADLAILVYLIWAETRALLGWRGVALLWALSLFASLPAVGIGLLLRRHRLRKAVALSEYERALALASQGQ